MVRPSTSTEFSQDKGIWKELQKWKRKKSQNGLIPWPNSITLLFTKEHGQNKWHLFIVNDKLKWRVSRPTWSQNNWLLLQYFPTSLLPCPCFWRKVECAKVGSLISFQDTTLPSNTFFFLYLPLKLGPHPLDQIQPSQPTSLGHFQRKLGSFKYFSKKSE